MSAGKKSPPDDGDEELVDPEAEGEEDEGELHGGAVELPHQYRHQLVHKSLHLNWLLFRIVTFSVKKMHLMPTSGHLRNEKRDKGEPVESVQAHHLVHQAFHLSQCHMHRKFNYVVIYYILNPPLDHSQSLF